MDEDVTGRLSISNAPVGFEYEQSSQQAFYFIQSIEKIEIGDWILAYYGDEVIGAREWQGNTIDIPAMGDDGNDFTMGYIDAGKKPQFKLYKDDELIDLEGDVPKWNNNQIYVLPYLSQVQIPKEYSLDRAYPNPFNPITTLKFALPVESEVSFRIYNLQGREVVELINQNMDAGYHYVKWNADSQASGIYFVRMISGQYINTQKLMLVK